MTHLPLRDPDDDILPLLRSASSEDLGILVEYLHKPMNEGLSSVAEFKKQNPRAADGVYDGDHTLYAGDIAAEIQRYGGNTFSNLFRGGKGVPYIEVLRDVADQLKVNYGKNADVQTIESQIQIKVLEKAYEQMSDEERGQLLRELGVGVANGIPASLPVMALQGAIRLSGFAAYKLAAIVANAVAKILIGRGLSFAVTGTLMKAIKVFAGPIGWAVSAIWTAIDLAGPAYRVTIPCVLQVAYMRQKSFASSCPCCNEIQAANSRFCSSCGASMSEQIVSCVQP